MSTNYYACFKNKAIVNKYFGYEEYEKNILDDKGIVYCVHIGKRSMGWKPLFEAHPAAYSSVDDMIAFFNKYADDLVDEYNRSYTLDELKKELIDWNKDVTPHEEFYSEKVGYVTIPIDHTIFAKKDGSLFLEFTNKPAYYNDKDGYNFLYGDFS